jgi:hypothetical protein
MGEIRMSGKERRRLGVMARVDAGEINLRDASVILGISYRQVKRIRSRYREKGDAGLVHLGRGRKSNRGYPEGFKVGVMSLYCETYKDFGPVLFSEKLSEDHNLDIDHETLRRWLIKDGLWVKARKRKTHRTRRRRKEHFGELIQMDGSFHKWFGEEENCLMVMVDDATGKTMALMREEETTEAAMSLLWSWIRRYGVPVALYTDRKNVYITDREPTFEEELKGELPLTVFGKACRKLGIKIQPAYSPQAKGRVERRNGLFQDRLVKELGLLNIKTLEETNRMLGSFTDKLNGKFSKEPYDPADYHMPLPERIRLDEVFCIEDRRTVQNDWTISHEGRLYQIKAQNNLPPARNKVVVRRKLDGSMQILYADQSLDFKEIQEREPAVKVKTIKPRKVWKPAPDHPWRSSRKNTTKAGAVRGTVPLTLTP